MVKIERKEIEKIMKDAFHYLKFSEDLDPKAIVLDYIAYVLHKLMVEYPENELEEAFRKTDKKEVNLKPFVDEARKRFG